jgi:hypothetical protein
VLLLLLLLQRKKRDVVERDAWALSSSRFDWVEKAQDLNLTSYLILFAACFSVPSLNHLL